MYGLTWRRQVPRVPQQRFPSVCACGGSESEPAPAVGLTPGYHLPARSRVAPPGHWDSQRALCWGWAAGSPGGRLAVPLQSRRRALGHCESGIAKGERPAAGRHGKWRAPARVAGADLVFWARPRSPHQPLRSPLAPAAPPGPAAAAPPIGRAKHWDGTPAGVHMHCSDSHRQHVDAQQVLLGFSSQMLESGEQGQKSRKNHKFTWQTDRQIKEYSVRNMNSNIEEHSSGGF